MRVGCGSLAMWLFVVAGTLDVAAASMEATKKVVASEAFAMYQAVFGESPEHWGKELEQMLKKDGFVSNGSTWILTNETGQVLINAFPGQQLFLRFRPTVSAPIGDATLAALIGKASAVTISGGETIDVALAVVPTSKSGQSCRMRQQLTFRLGGGLWSETSVLFDCTRSK